MGKRVKLSYFDLDDRFTLGLERGMLVTLVARATETRRRSNASTSRRRRSTARSARVIKIWVLQLAGHGSR